MTAIEAPYVNLLDPAFYVDPGDAYRWLRDNAPAYWDPVQRLWGISRYQDVVDVEKNGARYSSFFGSRPRIDQRADTSMINKDDPDHQNQRSLVLRQFTPRAVRQREDYVRGLVDELIDEVLPHGTCDAIDALASRLPAMVIGDKLGYPRELWTKVREWSEVTMFEAGQTPKDGVYPERTTMQAGGGVIADFAGETMKIIAQRRAEPQRRSHFAVVPERGRRSPVDRSRSDLGDDPRARRGRRDDPHGHRVDDLRTRAAPRPEEDPRRQPGGARRDRRRGVHPMGDTDPEHAAHGHRRSRIARADRCARATSCS